MHQYSKSARQKLASAVKAMLSIFPPTFPSKLYHAVSVIPLLKPLTHVVIRSFIPPHIQIEEGTVHLNQHDVTVCGALALGMFEQRELDLFRKMLRPGMTVVDIGANIGLYSIIASHHVGPTGKVFAYEPEQENFSFLSRNISLNNFTQSIALPLGLSDSKGERQLYLAKNNKGHHSFSEDAGADKSITILTDTLDQSLEEHNSSRVDLIKMDIEGAEPLALDGMHKTISDNPDIILFTEIYPKAIRRLGRDPMDFLKALDSHGLLIWIIDENIPKPMRLESTQFESYLEAFPRGESFHNLYASRKPLF